MKKKNDSKYVNGDLFREMVISGANDLFNHYPEIDKLNVFPVPDGDTGTNMNLTITSGSKEISNIVNNNIGEVAKIFSRGLLMGARGNSGVILSQIFRGFSSSLVGKEKVTIKEFADAWTKGAEVAYKAVMKPQEGTILTVVRESAEALSKAVNEKTTITTAMQILLKAAQVSLEHTPELLPVLKEVGVVDSGGAGLVRIFEGMYLVCIGEVVDRNSISANAYKKKENDQVIHNVYDVELVVKLNSEKRTYEETLFTRALSAQAKDVNIVRKDDYLKITLKTERPGGILNSIQNYGSFMSLDIKNENGEKVDDDFFTEKAEWKDFAIIVTSVGEGLNKLFESLNVNYIVSGGQTMNPSTEDFVAAINTVHAKHVAVLPNNKNILMAAQQACEVVTDCECRVVPTKTIMQGISACMMVSEGVSFDENIESMTDAIKNTKSGQVTFSIKDTKIDDVDIKKDYFMGISESKIKCCVEDKHECAKQLISSMITEDDSIVTIIYGEDVNDEEANSVKEYIEETFDIEVELHAGNQPVYSYFIGVE